MNQEIKNLYMALILSVFIIIGYNKFNEKKLENAPVETEQSAETNGQDAVKTADEAAVTIEKKDSLDKLPSEASSPEKDNEPRIIVKNEKVNGSIRIRGARIDDIVLTKYKETIEKNSPNVTLFNKSNSEKPYYAEFGWISNDNSLKLPNVNTVWETKTDLVTPENKAVLKWDNGEGLIFYKTIEIDQKYMFKVTETVENNTGKPVQFHHYGLISRTGRPQVAKGAVHDGPVGVLDDKLEEVRYDELIKEQKESFQTKGGWLGITDRFWLSALAFNQDVDNVNARFIYTETAKGNRYQADFLLPEITVQSGEKVSSTGMLFAGAKEVRTLDTYRKELGINKFDLAIDFGWYYFLTKPFFFILEFLYNLIGNMGLAILLFATFLRGAMVPIATASNVSMAKMKKLQPKVQEIQSKYPDDKIRAQQELMTLYKREKVNPAAGCLPMLIQIPVFFSLYKVLNISIEIRHAPFYGWIQDLSAPDPSSVFTLFGMVNWPIPSFLNIGILPLLMGVTMFLQQRLNPKPTDKSQAAMMKYMPIFFTFLLGRFAAGLVIYWTWSNLFSIIQQRLIMKRMGVEPS